MVTGYEVSPELVPAEPHNGLPSAKPTGRYTAAYVETPANPFCGQVPTVLVSGAGLAEALEACQQHADRSGTSEP